MIDRTTSLSKTPQTKRRPTAAGGRPARRLSIVGLGRPDSDSGSTLGTTMAEFALVLPIFLLLVFAVTDFARLFYIEMTLQNAVREAGRYAITGNHQPDPSHPNQTLSRVQSINQVAQQAAMGLDVSNLQIVSVSGGSGKAGGPGDTVTISLTTKMQILTPIVAQFFKNGSYTFTVSVSFKNEPFPPGNTAQLRHEEWQESS